jgi:hypothetical protein
MWNGGPGLHIPNTNGEPPVARVEINNGGHQVVVDDPNGQRQDVARDARRLWEKTKLQPGEVGFQRTPPIELGR